MTENTGQQAPTSMSFSPGMLSSAGNAVKKATGSEWFLFAIVLFFHSINAYGIPYLFEPRMWFNGINITYVWKTPALIGKVFYTEVITSIVFWIIVAAVIIFSRRKSFEEHTSNILMIAAFVFVAALSGIHTVNDLQINSGIIGTLIEIILIIFIRKVMLLSKKDAIEANYITIALIFADFFLINLIQFAFPAKIAVINRMIFPILPLAVLAYMDDSLWRNIILFAVVVSYILLFMNQTGAINANFRQGFTGTEATAGTEAKKTIWEKLKGLYGGVKQQYNDSQNLISGNYYSSVEEYQYTPLGVYLEDVKPSDREFLENETVIVWGRLKAYTLSNQAINISVVCSAKKNNKDVPGEISPKKGQYTVESYDEQFITCTFSKDNNNLISNESNVYTITINATFNFKTQAYLKTYYMEKERKRVMISENIDIFQAYGITDTNPTAVFTNGPVKIGMETTTPPTAVPVDNNNDFSSYLGLTIDNNWNGNIVKIDSVEILVPNGMRFDMDNCKDFLQYDRYSSVDDKHHYFLKNSSIATSNSKPYRLPKSYKCALTLEDPQKLLGNNPISLKDFFVEVDYKYQISQSTSATVVRRSEKTI